MRPDISRIYGLPIVGRVGLAHSLLAWARCELWCKDNGVQMLAPNWNHLRIGPYLRGERDKREYHRLFHFPHYTSGFKRALIIATFPTTEATASAEEQATEKHSQKKREIVVFRNKVTKNFESHFHEITGRGRELRDALVRMTKPRYLPDQITFPHIAIHIRLGDFSPPSAQGAHSAQGTTNTRQPIDWYACMLANLRVALGQEIPAIVYSDGSDEELAKVLKIPGVKRASSNSAITDLLALSTADVLISSGSGFSIWGSFLGNVPRICFPDQRLIRALGEPTQVDSEIELSASDEVPPAFARSILNSIDTGKA